MVADILFPLLKTVVKLTRCGERIEPACELIRNACRSTEICTGLAFAVSAYGGSSTLSVCWSTQATANSSCVGNTPHSHAKTPRITSTTDRFRFLDFRLSVQVKRPNLDCATNIYPCQKAYRPSASRTATPRIPWQHTPYPGFPMPRAAGQYLRVMRASAQNSSESMLILFIENVLSQSGVPKHHQPSITGENHEQGSNHRSNQ